MQADLRRQLTQRLKNKPKGQKTSLLSFLRKTKIEMKKVDWPSRPAVIRLTGIVIGVSALVAIFVAGLDIMFTKLMGAIIK